MPEEGGYFETLGVLIVVAACFAGGVFSTGIISYLLYGVGIFVLLLWIGRYVMEGAAASYKG